MTQLTLFDAPPVARARRSDPESSHIAAANVATSGQLAGDRASVFCAIGKQPGSTAGELAQYLGHGWNNVRVSRRTADLERIGMIHKGKQRPCKVKGSIMCTWFTGAKS